MKFLSAFAAGALFAVGLTIGGMTQPSKVIGFLDVTGAWDPSLAFVMGGALLVYSVALGLITRRSAPVLGPRFQIPTRRDLTPRLVVGAGLFGVGWAIGGFCPGPALASLGAGVKNSLIFLPAMVGGMLLFKVWDRWMAGRAEKRTFNAVGTSVGKKVEKAA